MRDEVRDLPADAVKDIYRSDFYGDGSAFCVKRSSPYRDLKITFASASESVGSAVFSDCFGTPVLKPSDPFFHHLPLAADRGVGRIEASGDVVRLDPLDMIPRMIFASLRAKPKSRGP